MIASMGNQSRNRAHSSAEGFSLVELLVVVAVILVIAAIAIPNFINSKVRANESAAVANVRNITTAEAIYSTSYSIGFSPDLPSLGGTGSTVSATNAELIDSVLSNTQQKTGYSYSYTVLTTDTSGQVTGYSINADPLAQNYTGVRHFYSDQTAVVRVNLTATAGPTDNPL
jgi:type IV pilus assembly protein PilA